MAALEPASEGELQIAGQAVTTVQNATSTDTASSVQAQIAAQQQLLSQMQQLQQELVQLRAALNKPTAE